MVKGKSIDEALQLTNKAVAEALDGLPPVKMHCSLAGGAGHSRRGGGLSEKAPQGMIAGRRKDGLLPEIHGNTEGIRKTVLDELTTLYDVQLEPGQFMPQDLLQSLWRLFCVHEP